MDPRYRIDDASEIISPGLVIFREILEENLAKMVTLAGQPARLRPHCKTHKMREIAELELARSITKHKAATFAEAEMLADAGVRDIFLAYNLVGPSIRRAVRFVEKFPNVTFSATADHPAPIAELGQAMTAAGQSMEVVLDLDVGMHRTGIEPGPQAKELYRQIVETPGLHPGGFHVYDGHHHQASREERRVAVLEPWAKVIAFRDELNHSGWPVPRIIAGGTGSFPIHAESDDPTVELSPGTCVLNDAGYTAAFPDLVFTPAALLLTRVISRPASDRVTLDLGYKAVASDPPAGKRLTLPAFPGVEQILQNEEHLMIQGNEVTDLQPGDVMLAIPRHICPTVALHRQATVVENGQIVGAWDVVGRDRCLTI